MKSILVLVGGGERDQVVFQTALAAALPLAAHLDCLHIHVSAGEAARYSNLEFARGAGLRSGLDGLQSKAQTFSKLAAEHIRDFCAAQNIEMTDAPANAGKVTASFRVEKDNAHERLTFHARHSDLIVMGRARQTQGLAPDTLDRLVLNCGRPMLVAASAAPAKVGTVMVCWKESGNAARAVAAATPILTKASRVVFASVLERDEGGAEAVNDIARQFGRNGVAAEAQTIAANGKKIPDLLAEAAEACGADLLVMGAFGHSRARELLFGSCTEAFIKHADKPILLMH
jgi:nucleotide-binding universal stress UspA family protein